MMVAAKISPGGLLRNRRTPRWRPRSRMRPIDAADDVADGGADEQADDTAGAEGVAVVADLVAHEGAEEDDDEADALDEDHAVAPGGPGLSGWFMGSAPSWLRWSRARGRHL